MTLFYMSLICVNTVRGRAFVTENVGVLETFRKTSDFPLSISSGWMVMFLDCRRTVFEFRSWLDLLGTVLALWISVQITFKSFQKD